MNAMNPTENPVARYMGTSPRSPPTPTCQTCGPIHASCTQLAEPQKAVTKAFRFLLDMHIYQKAARAKLAVNSEPAPVTQKFAGDLHTFPCISADMREVKFFGPNTSV